jgi:hypothetical protein
LPVPSRDSNELSVNEIPAAIMNKWKQYFQDLLGDVRNGSCLRKETEKKTNKVEEMPKEN